MLIQTLRRRLLYILAATAAILGCLWWFGPWSAAFRYQHTGLLGLWQATKRNPSDFLAWRELGLRLAHHGDPLAELPLRRAHALKPGDPEIATGLGELLMSTSRFPEAFQILKSAVGSHPAYEPARMSLGRLYMHRGSNQHAIEQFQAAVAHDAGNSDAWYEMAQCYLDTLQMAKGSDAIGRALAIAPNEPQFLALKAAMDAAVGRVDDGIRTAQRAASLAPHDLKVQATLVNILLAHERGPEDLSTAEQHIADIERAAPKLGLLDYYHGELERLRGNWNAAIPYLEAAIRYDPTKQEAYSSLEQCLRRSGRAREADKVLAAFKTRQAMIRKIMTVYMQLEDHPSDPDLHVRMADLLLESGNRAGAFSELQSALDLKPGSPEIRKRLESLQAVTSR